MPDRIDVAEEHRHELLIHDDRFMTGHAVIVGEWATANEADIERLEVAAVDRHERGSTRRILGRLTPTIELDSPHRRADVRRSARDRDGRERRIRAEPRFDAAVHREPLIRRRHLRGRRTQRHGHDLRCVGREVGSVNREKASHHEARTDEQHQREADFRDEQDVGPHVRGPGGRARVLLDRIVHVAAGEVNRWDQSEQERARDADAAHEREHAMVHRPALVVPVGEVDAANRIGKRLHPGDRQDESQRAGNGGQQHAFDQELPDHPPARRTQRRPHADFT